MPLFTCVIRCNPFVYHFYQFHLFQFAHQRRIPRYSWLIRSFTLYNSASAFCSSCKHLPVAHYVCAAVNSSYTNYLHLPVTGIDLLKVAVYWCPVIVMGTLVTCRLVCCLTTRYRKLAKSLFRLEASMTAVCFTRSFLSYRRMSAVPIDEFVPM